jgi:hypothetical protein
MKTRLFLLIAMACPAWAGTTFDFFTLPSSGAILGAPGATMGWGYQIVNQDPVDYLMAVDLQTTGNFTVGTPNSLFDFPIVAPGQTVTVYWSQAATGLMELTFDGAPGNDTGTFDLQVQWFSDNPLSCDSCDITDPSQTYAEANYSATTYLASATPEPSSWVMVAIAGGAMLMGRFRREYKRSSRRTVRQALPPALPPARYAKQPRK